MVGQTISEGVNVRIQSIDVMRGFAILGIFLVNIYSFHTPMYYMDTFSLAETRMDQWVYGFVDVFAQGSFYPLFTILFGYGFYILKSRVELRGEKFNPIALRRMLALLLFGFLHAFFIWPGDILITYAILGLLLILFQNVSVKGLILTATLLFFIPNLFLLLLLYFITLLPPELMEEAMAVNIEVINVIYQSGSFLEITMQRIDDWIFANLNPLLLLPITILPMGLIGLALGKLKMLIPTDRNITFFKRTLWIALPLGLLIKTMPYWGKYNEFTMYIQDLFGGILLTFAYIASIFFLNRLWKGSLLLGALEKVGKISLSNYLFQTIICSFIFYGYGFGLYGKVTFTTTTLMAIGIFIVQLVLSHLWLKRFRTGPFEWILRGFTYKRFAKLSRKSVGEEG